MAPALAITLILMLAVLLAVTATLAGMLWLRIRSGVQIRVDERSPDLTERVEALESRITQLERVKRGEPRTNPRLHPGGPATLSSQRCDTPKASAIPGPTLIVIPDLSAPPAEPATA